MPARKVFPPARSRPPTTLAAGVAWWSHRVEGDRMLVKVNPSVRGTFSSELNDRTAFNEAGQLLGAAAVERAAGRG